MNSIPRPSKIALAFTLGIAAMTAEALPVRVAQSPTEALQLLSSAAGGSVSQSLRAIDAYTAVHAKPGQLLLADGNAQLPVIRAQNFLAAYGALPGVTDVANQLSMTRISRDFAGNTHVHLNQMQSGLAVFGARLVVHMNDAGITGVSGVFIPGLESLSATPAKSISALRERGMVAAHKLHPKVGNLAIESTRLMFYRTGLLKGVETQKNYLAYEVMVKGGSEGYPVRERIILNADTGNVLNRINEIHSIKNREIYTPNQDVPPIMPEGSPIAPPDEPLVLDDPTATSDRTPLLSPQPQAANLYYFAGGTYDLYKNLFGREGYNDGDVPGTEQVQKSVYLVNDQCPNAYWNGDSTNYCPGFDADDVVSHEWSHAYTEYTHGLVYQYQSGALNESYSDIFGETYDLVNGREGPLGFTLTEGDYFKNGGSRWVVGEDLSETAAEALLRDMWDPDDFAISAPGTGVPVFTFSPSPGSTITSENYYCDTGDNGGVHTNSGVPNHAFAMLVDGRPNANDSSVFNNVEVPKIGMTKAAAIYFQAETHYQTPTTNFIQHADALDQSCIDLIGATLKDVTGAVSTEKITSADCAAIKKASLAVEFRNVPNMTVAQKCGYVTVLKAESTTPALCAAGTFFTPKFSEGFNGTALPTGWTQGKNVSGDLDLPPWTVTTNLPAPHTGSAAFFPNNGEGTCAAGGDASASHYLDTPEITVTGAADFFKFTHFMQSESGFDGGNLKYSFNGGAFALVPVAAFKYNGHSSVFTDGPVIPGTPADPTGLVGGNNTSPNAGQVAWTGSDQGEATGSWGTTIVDLSKLTTAAKAGDKVKFRFDFANDGCGGNRGWFVEDVAEFICGTTPPPNLAPSAILTLDKSTGEAPLTVQVTRGGTDPDAGDRVVSYTIAYGDGSTQADQSYPAGQPSTVTAAHVFNAAGIYTISLKVKDSFGLTSEAVTKTVTVTPKAGGPTTPTPNPTTPIAPAPVDSVAASTEGSGRFGGAMGVFALLPFAGVALRRRRRG